LLATLCGEPWCYTPQQAVKLTYYQVKRILFHPRDDRGIVVGSPKLHPVDRKELFARYWLRIGVPGWRVEEMWMDAERRQQQTESSDAKFFRRRSGRQRRPA
jgi:hypothetical protein